MGTDSITPSNAPCQLYPNPIPSAAFQRISAIPRSNVGALLRYIPTLHFRLTATNSDKRGRVRINLQIP